MNYKNFKGYAFISLFGLLTLMIISYAFLGWNRIVDGGFAGAAATVSISFGLLYVAWSQLKGISDVTIAEFVYKFKNDFFGKDARELMMLFDIGALKYKNRNLNETEVDNLENYFDYFEIDNNLIDTMPLGEKRKKIIKDISSFTAYEIDDFLLGHFEDIGIFEERGFIDIVSVYDEFSYYIENVWNNCEIKKYILNERDESGADIYEKFEYIYKKCASYGKAKKENRNILVWRIKWFFINI